MDQPARKPFGALTALNAPALFTGCGSGSSQPERHPGILHLRSDVQDADDTSIPADVEEKLLPLPAPV